MIRLGLLGATGRMGQEVSRLIETEFAKVATLESSASLGSSLEPLMETDAVIDFSSPQAMLELAAVAERTSGQLPAFVVGSTGWKPHDRRAVEKLAERTPVLISSNFSTGVLATAEILKMAAPLLEKLGYTPTMVETHHKHKKDAPSGTALSLQAIIQQSHKEPMQVLSVRAGEVVGDHEITFYSGGDQIKIGHFAQNRSIFARGAIQAALWLADLTKKPANQRPDCVLGMNDFFKHLTQ